ncbi:MAG: hypothetical protein ACXWCM_13855 [Acidimicrobiales bacterium]
MTRPPPDKPPKSSSDPTPRATTTTEPPGPADPLARRRLLIRLGAGVVAVALLATLAVLVLSGRTTARSADAYCSRMGDTRDLGQVLATGDAGEIESAVRQLEAAGKVAPTEIEPAMDLYVGYASKLSDAVATSGTDEASIAAALKAATVAQNAQADQVAAAVTQVDAYVTSTCGFALTPATGATTNPSGG